MLRDCRPVGRDQNIGDGLVILKFEKKVTARHSPAPPRKGGGGTSRTHEEEYVTIDIRDYRPVGREQNIGDGPDILKYEKRSTHASPPHPPQGGGGTTRTHRSALTVTCPKPKESNDLDRKFALDIQN